jgi:hypothetical protein
MLALGAAAVQSQVCRLSLGKLIVDHLLVQVGHIGGLDDEGKTAAELALEGLAGGSVHHLLLDRKTAIRGPGDEHELLKGAAVVGRGLEVVDTISAILGVAREDANKGVPRGLRRALLCKSDCLVLDAEDHVRTPGSRAAVLQLELVVLLDAVVGCLDTRTV